MTMALPASRAAVGMVAVAVPAVRTRPPGKETYMMKYCQIIHLHLHFFDECVCISYVFLTSGSECHTDGVNDGSGSSRDGEEAACQSEDDKALAFKMKIHVYMFL